MAPAVGTFNGEVVFGEGGPFVVRKVGVDTMMLVGFAVLVAGSVTELVVVPLTKVETGFLITGVVSMSPPVRGGTA